MGPVRPPSQPGARLFISNLAYNTTWQQLKDHFKVLGNVVYCTVFKDKATGQSKGSGIVEFEHAQDARTAISKLSNSIMVHGLPFAYDNMMLRDMFKSITGGNILNTHDQLGRGKGYGLVCFDTPAAAQAAIDKYNGSELHGRLLSVGLDKKLQGAP
ncbi:uncharacterized protein HaLaN_09915 [Haematococcus lacustris]|uniref:RRM domain-containing protein n=1 Tax=Haematococcus lacustris TaxID=44745 RepID=A0A699Z3U7_HAELA|nr:uncharacterized protein HaLaN_09915 [Haematococcus lacustris]